MRHSGEQRWRVQNIPWVAEAQLPFYYQKLDLNMWTPWVFLLEAVAIVTGNVAVLVIFIGTSSLRKRRHFLIVNLAAADLLVGLVSVPLYVALNFQYQRKLVIVFAVQDILFGTASVFGLTALAIERAYAVYFPFKYRTLWKGVYMIGIAVIWIMAVVWAFSQLYDKRILLTGEAVILTSLITIIISYTLIWIKMNCVTQERDNAIRGHDKQLAVTLLIVTIVSLVAWIPFQVVNIYGAVCDGWCLVDQHALVGTTKFLQYGNSLVNPVIYALRMPHFKRALVRFSRCGKVCLGCEGIQKESRQQKANQHTKTSYVDPQNLENDELLVWETNNTHVAGIDRETAV